MMHNRKEIRRDQMRVLQNALEIVHRQYRHVGLVEQLCPLGGGACLKNAREFGVNRVDIDRASGEGREFRIASQIVATGGLEEILPLLVVIDDHADIAVGGLVWPPVARQ